MSDLGYGCRAVILAGGKGTRLRPYTVVIPKPLVPLGDYPIVELIIRRLARQGFRRITLAVNHHANLIKAFFNDGSQWGVHIDYSLELKPLSTIAPLRLIPDLPENFLLMNGDVLTDLDLKRLYEAHVHDKRLFTIAASERRQLIDYGVLTTDSNKLLTGFSEKPHIDYLVSMGVYIVNRRVLEIIPPDTKFGFDDLMNFCLGNGTPIHVERHPGYWLDIGRPDDYAQAVNDFEELRRQYFDDES
jgi:NDP-sugar pyrophosphorylase family protein